MHPDATSPAKPRCHQCEAACVMMATSTSRIPSSMEAAVAQEMEHKLSTSKCTWRLHPVLLVPSCTPTCNVCSSYIDHLARGYAGTADPDAPCETTTDPEEEDDSDDADSDDGASPWRPPTPSDFLLDTGGDEEAVDPQMPNLFLLQCAHGRAATHDLFRADPQALGRAQSKVASRLEKMAAVDGQLDSIRVRASAIEREIQELKRARARVESMRAMLYRPKSPEIPQTLDGAAAGSQNNCSSHC
ncbi:hypothetical protein B0H16DRAFT_1548643 [Mycena metata]|uniref:Uncharacterized protein n=1 Tax=Mycena metata TaxID=1033252 RepID=A0AAD7IWZ0_9AGAR|nr:hypothetical protein B0H16DRAFT_1729864 [Mycena metata]KAJ7751047.1 hypothetical protein B0H16DRAFT_1548643 [Mycena metata]